MNRAEAAAAEQVWLPGRLREVLRETADEQGRSKSNLLKRYTVDGLRRDGKLKEGE